MSDLEHQHYGILNVSTLLIQCKQGTMLFRLALVIYFQ